MQGPMPDEIEHPDLSESAHATGADPAALVLSLNGASREISDAYLEKQAKLCDEQIDLVHEQTTLARLQSEDLRREDKVRHWSLRVRHISDVMKLIFELAAAAAAIFAVVLIAGAIWSAVHDNGVIVEAFDIPDAYARNGLSGKALAEKLLDRLAAMQNATDSIRLASSYKNNWGDDFNVQIPDTGISVTEFDNYLHQKLGHQTRITGSLYTADKKLVLVARVNDKSVTFNGNDSDLDTIVQKAAEAIYSQTQPYRYGEYLRRSGRIGEALVVFQRLSQDPSRLERAWADMGLRIPYIYWGRDPHGTIALDKAALAIEPDFLIAEIVLSGDSQILGHDQEAMTAARKAIPMLQAPNSQLTETGRVMLLQSLKESLSFEMGDFTDVVTQSRIAEDLPDYDDNIENARQNEIEALGFLHDATSMNRRAAEFPAPSEQDSPNRFLALTIGEFALERWDAVLRDVGALNKIAHGANQSSVLPLSTNLWPMLAVAEAETGHVDEARLLVGKTPLDCMWCVIARGRVDQRDHKRGPGDAAFWYASAERQAPSLPEPNLYWGMMLLANHAYDKSIAEFARANQKSPHFADPLEMWAEALMGKNRSDLALGKFADANKFAPNWGRLHLKWGEALLYTGRANEAKKEFVIATNLYLSKDDAAELARARRLHT
jgi:tetratricopeptide (TPR) repeat protein